MARHSGREGKIKIGANTVAAVRSWNIVATMPTDDTTAMVDGWQSHVVGIPGWTGSAEVLFDPDDTTGQGAATVGASLGLALYSEGDSAGKTYFEGTATVTERRVAAAYQGAVTLSLSFLGNGELTEDTV